MDKRYPQLVRLFARFSSGDFDSRVHQELHGEPDTLYTLVSAANMMGYDLRQSTVHRDDFLNLCNSMREWVFIVAPGGVISGNNKAARASFPIGKEHEAPTSLDALQPQGVPSLYNRIRRNLRGHERVTIPDIQLITAKGESFEVNIEAFNMTASGRRAPDILVIAAKLSCAAPVVEPSHPSGLNKPVLTERENEVLQWISRDCKRAAIARVLGISPKTYDDYRNALREKFDAETEVGIYKAARDWGFVK
jgi:DNA-binding CsgD family transcriptional regulator